MPIHRRIGFAFQPVVSFAIGMSAGLNPSAGMLWWAAVIALLVLQVAGLFVFSKYFGVSPDAKVQR